MKKDILKKVLLFVPAVFLLHSTAISQVAQHYFSWQQLPAIPSVYPLEEATGFAGHFGGVHDNVMLIAGGTNFAKGDRPWNGGKKIWNDSISVLVKNESGRYEWLSKKFALPKPLGYGASISTSDGVVCIGGENADEVSKSAFILQCDKGTGSVKVLGLPDLPLPLTKPGGAMLGGKIYVAGGHTVLDKPFSTQHFFCLDLEAARKGKLSSWESLPTWPGPSRIMPVMAVQNNGERDFIYLFSGREISSEKETVLNDGYSFDPKTAQWKKLSDIQIPGENHLGLIGAPSVPFGLHHILVFGGADGETHRIFRKTQEAYGSSLTPEGRDSLRQKMNSLADNHPGFSKKLLSYHTITDEWIVADSIPEASVVTQAFFWGNDVIIPFGETRPAVRSPKIWIGSPEITSSEVIGWFDYSVIALYFLTVILIGIRYSSKNKNTDDYFKAGGRIPGWVSGVAIFGTLMSSITFLTTPAKTFSGDWLYFLPTLSSLAVAPIVAGYIVPVYMKMDITTAYEYLESRFNLATRILGSLCFLLFRVAKIGVILLLPAITISAITGMDVITCVVVVGIFSTLYCMSGGIEAVIWTEVLQVIVLLLGALLSFIIISMQLKGGVAGMFAMSAQEGKLDFISWDFSFTELTVFIIISYWIGGGLAPYTSDQAVIQKYLTTKDVKKATKGIWVNAIIIATSSFLFFAIGTALFAFYKVNPARLNPTLATPESIFPWFIVNELPAGIKGMVIAGIFAAAMSSLNTSINSMSSAIVTDYLRIRRSILSASQQLNLARIMSGIFGLLGTGLSVLMYLYEVGSLWDLMRKLIGLLTGGLAGLFLLGMFTKRANATGAMIGFAGSSLVQFYISSKTDLHFMTYSLTGITSCFVLGYIGSILFHKKSQIRKDD